MNDSCLLFSPDGAKVWALPGSDDGSMRVWFPAQSMEPLGAEPAFAQTELPPAPGAELFDLRTLFGHISPDDLAALVRARELLQWRLDNRFCGRCGAALVRHQRPSEHAMRCPSCGASFWPRISPAVITLVTRRDGNEVLLEKGAGPRAGAFWRLVAGFVDAGETAEAAVHREIMEETGVRVKNLRYVRSQSWPFPGSLMLAYRAEWESGDPTPDGVEVSACRFFSRDSLPELPPGMSVARALLDEWAAEA